MKHAFYRTYFTPLLTLIALTATPYNFSSNDGLAGGNTASLGPDAMQYMAQPAPSFKSAQEFGACLAQKGITAHDFDGMIIIANAKATAMQLASQNNQNPMEAGENARTDLANNQQFNTDFPGLLDKVNSVNTDSCLPVDPAGQPEEVKNAINQALVAANSDSL